MFVISYQGQIVLFQQKNKRGNEDEGQERGIEFIIAGEYPAKPFELLKEAFDQMVLFVSVPIYIYFASLFGVIVSFCESMQFHITFAL